ncbi:antibiotic biosynthesis monooxygenase family protein [Sphingopyxis sp. P1IMeth2]
MEVEFEAAIAKARPLIEASPGFISLTLRRGVGNRTALSVVGRMANGRGSSRWFSSIRPL